MNDAPDIGRLLAKAIAAMDPTIEKRIEDDPQAHLDLVVIASQADAETGRILTAAVGSARSAGLSWEAVGKALGMTRQAAQQRFGIKADDADASRTRLVGLTATNEMDVLDEMGRKGWHSVGHGPLFHDLEKSEVQWEHRRVFVGSRKAKVLENQGWELSGAMWFPWHYFKRATDRPAEEDS